MNKAHDASKNNWWRNLPDITTPITQDELNRLETTVDVMDDRVVGFDLSKANQSDLLQTIKTFTYNTETGVWVFTWWNGSTLTIDQNIEKIPVSFSMSPQGIITMTTSDGTQYTCDIATLIKTYSFLDSDTIDFTDTVDSDGNHTITADIKNGSITGEKLQPNYLADCVLAKQGAETAETNAETAETNALAHQYTSEAWAKGTKNDVPVTPIDAQYHDNAYYWAQQARAIVGDKVDSFNGRIGTVVAEDGDYESQMIVPETGAIVGQVPVVRNVGTGQDVKLRYVNEDLDIGLKPHIIVISETGSTVTLTKGTKVIYASETSPEHFEADVTEFGTWVIDSVLGGDDAQVSLVVDAVKIYTVDDSHWHADITVTYPTGGTCSCSKSGTTTLYATGSPYTFTVHESGTYTITAIANGETYTDTVEVTTSGQTESLTIPEGSTITPTDSVATLLSCAGIHDTSITTVSDLLADTTTLSAVINSHNAIDYLVRSKSFACGSVPIMTSNTTPSGTCIQNGADTGNYAYSAFDGNDSTVFTTTAAIANAYVGYTFPSAKKIVKCKALIGTNATAESHYTYKIQGSNDGSNWTDLADAFSLTLSGQGSTWVDIDLDSTNTYTSFRLIHPSTMEASRRMCVYTLQFYEQDAVFNEDATAMSYIGLNNYAANTLLADSDWLTAICNSTYFESVLNAKVPTMTSDTTPSGVASASSKSENAWYAFDNATANWGSAQTVSAGGSQWIQYQFDSANSAKRVEITPYARDTKKRLKNYKIQGSNDGSNFTDIHSGTLPNVTTSGVVYETTTVIISNSNSYLYYRLYCVDSYDDAHEFYINKLQFYGREDV